MVPRNSKNVLGHEGTSFNTWVTLQEMLRGASQYLDPRRCWLSLAYTGPDFGRGYALLSDVAPFRVSASRNTTVSDPSIAYPSLGLQIVEQCQGRVDIMHYHIGPSASLEMTWSVAAEHYKTIMRDPGNINFVTIFREPRSHFLSFFYYFIAHSPGKVSATGSRSGHQNE